MEKQIGWRYRDTQANQFADAMPVPPSPILANTLAETAPLATAITTKQARSELLIIPVLLMITGGGRMVVIGIAPGTTTAPIEITRLVRRGIQLMGSYGSRVRTDLPEVLALATRGQVSVSQPITRRYRLEQADDAYTALHRGDIVGRAIVTMD